MKLAEIYPAKWSHYPRELPPDPPKPPRAPREIKPRRWTRDEDVRGKGTVIRCISMPAEDWTALDAHAADLGISRSEYLRRAARHLRTSASGVGATPASATGTSTSTSPARGHLIAPSTKGTP